MRSKDAEDRVNEHDQQPQDAAEIVPFLVVSALGDWANVNIVVEVAGKPYFGLAGLLPLVLSGLPNLLVISCFARSITYP